MPNDAYEDMLNKQVIEAQETKSDDLEFANFLEQLAADYRASGSEATADDFDKAARIISGYANGER